MAEKTNFLAERLYDTWYIIVSVWNYDNIRD